MAHLTGQTQMTSVTSKTILDIGLQMQGKDQVNKQMQEWQRRMDEHKQVERSATAHKLILERNFRMMEMVAKQGALHQQQPNTVGPHNNTLLCNSNQILIPILLPMHMTFQPATYVRTNLISQCGEHLNTQSEIPHLVRYSGWMNE